jgi:hypothetical protein
VRWEVQEETLITVQLRTRYGTHVGYADVETQNKKNVHAPVLPEIISLQGTDGRTFARDWDTEDLMAVFVERSFDWGTNFRLNR